MPFSEHLPGDTGSHQVRAQAPSLHGHSVCLLGQSQASGAWRAAAGHQGPGSGGVSTARRDYTRLPGLGLRGPGKAASSSMAAPHQRRPVSHNPQLCGGGSEPGLWHHDGTTQECQHWDGMAATCCSHPSAARPGQALWPSLLGRGWGRGEGEEGREGPTSPSAPHASALLLLLLLQATAATALGHHLLLDHVNDLVGDAQVLDGAAADIALWHPPKLVPVLCERGGVSDRG